jgi:uncharacterized membrane protein
MGKKTKSKRTQSSDALAQVPIRSAPNWALLAIGVLGMLLTAYLSWTSLSGGSVPGCSAGSGCDVVLASRWATLFGLPTALWGFFAYAGLGALAFIKRADTHWRYAWTAALFGVSFSVYLTTISITQLGATCPYCLTSLGLMTAALILTTYQRPTEMPRFSWRQTLIRRIPLAAMFVFALHLQYVALPEEFVNPIADPLVEHLNQIGAKFYGASWCEHCQQQKRFFGKAASRLPYIECKPGGPSAPLTTQCRDAYIASFPTWVVKDRRVEGVLSLAELAELSGFKAPSPATPTSPGSD